MKRILSCLFSISLCVTVGGWLLLDVNSSYSQAKGPKQVVEEVLAEFKSPLLIGDPQSAPEREKIKKQLQASGVEGFHHLIELAKQAPTHELNRMVPLLSTFQSPDSNGDRLVDLIQVRSGKAQDKYDLLASVPLYANLGFFKPTGKIKDFLFDLVATQDCLQKQCPMLKEWKEAGKDKETAELECLVHTGAVLSLFHINAPETLAFLKEMQNNPKLNPEVRECIAFYFEKIEKYKTLQEYYTAENREFPIVE